MKKVQKTYKIQDGGMFTWKFKMAAVFVKLYMSLPIHICIDLSIPLKIDRYTFFKDIRNSRGNVPPKRVEGSDNLNPIIFQQFDPKSTRQSKKINFSKTILRNYTSSHTNSLVIIFAVLLRDLCCESFKHCPSTRTAGRVSISKPSLSTGSAVII